MLKKVASTLLIAMIAVVAQADLFVFRANLNTAQEVRTPPVPTDAYGLGRLKVYTDTNGLIYYEGFLEARKLAGAPTGFHIHRGAFGTNGPVVVDFLDQFVQTVDLGNGNRNIYFKGRITDRTVSGTLVTRFQILDAIRAGNGYLNVHNSSFPSGEIRGQLAEVIAP